MSDELLEPNPDATVIGFPCYIVQSANAQGFIFQDCEGGGKLVCILTDDDLLDRYLVDIGLTGRPASRFDTAVELLEALENIPNAITHVLIDPPKLVETARTVRPIQIGSFKNRLALKLKEQLDQPGDEP